NKSIKKIFHKIYLHLPIFGELIKKVNSSRFSRTFSSLIDSGVDIVSALQIVSRTLKNENFREALENSSVQIRKGQDLSSTLLHHENIFPPMVIQMIKVGEKTGKLSEVLRTLADFYEEEIDRTTKNLSSIVEPVIMIIVGAAVGLFAISMIQPMYSMMSGI
ncbi:type II secretion system F family protein, partial [Patescibacteria group bacterium]